MRRWATVILQVDLAAKVTSKGQITIPKEVREALGIAEGDQIVFRVEQHRATLGKTPNLLDLACSRRTGCETRRRMGRGAAQHPAGPR